MVEDQGVWSYVVTCLQAGALVLKLANQRLQRIRHATPVVETYVVKERAPGFLQDNQPLSPEALKGSGTSCKAF